MNDLPPRLASHIPTIKCSDCGRDMDFVSMANHVCSAVPADNHSAPSYGPVPSLPTSNMGTTGLKTSLLRPQRPILPKIDSSVAPSGFLAGELTPASSNNGSVGSPVSATSARKSPWKAQRKTAMAVSRRPPSPALTNLDCAFPPFPTTSSKTSSSKDSKSSKPSSRNKTSKSRPQSPASSRRSSDQLPPSFSHSRTPSTNSSRQRSKPSPADDISTRPLTASAKRRPLLGNASFVRKPSTDDVPPIPAVTQQPPLVLGRAETAPGAIAASGNDTVAPKPGLHRFATADDIAPYPGSNPPHRAPSYKFKAPAPIVSNISLDPDGRPSLAKSPMAPQPSSGSSLGRRMTRIFGRSRSRSVSSRREIVRAALSDGRDELPTPPISSSAFESPRQAPLTPYTDCTTDVAHIAQEPLTDGCKHSIKVPEGGNDLQQPGAESKTEQQPLRPAETMTFDFEWNKTSAIPPGPPTSISIAERPTDSNRASVDSASPYGSDEFTERTASSRSSAPANDELARKSSEAVRLSVVHSLVAEMPAPLRPRNPELSADSPTDPFFVDGRLSPIPPQDTFRDDSSHSRLDTEIEQRPGVTLHVPRKESLAGQNQSLEPHKGICRGCSKRILPKQKSVSSADGGLTGKYHKECFVCWTCKAPFSTPEIYVHADHPYCAYHYHESENSLCATCGKGIEGLYMETANVAGRGREKHHPHCLKCTTCLVQLNNDYFELSGKVYCERDAFRLASMPRVHNRSPARPSPLVREYISSGNPDLSKGKNFPERRITRLIDSMNPS